MIFCERAPERVGGPNGDSFLKVGKALLPEVLILEAEPTSYPRAPVSKKRIYIDVRNQISPQTITFDRRNEELDKVADFERALLKHIDDEFPEIAKEITDTGEMSDTLADRLKEVVANFKKNFASSN